MGDDYGLLAEDAAEPGDEWEEIDVSDTEADRVARRRDREFDEFRERIKDADQFKVEASVFDDATYAALYRLVQNGYIDAVGGAISSGKEATVFSALGGRAAAAGLAEAGVDRPGEDGPAADQESTAEGGPAAVDGPAAGEGSTVEEGRVAGQAPTGGTGEGLEVAVKVYRISTSNFRDMRGYLEGDPRFAGIGSDRKEVVLAWVRKEFANLRRAHRAGVRVPVPLAVERNVLVMEYIGAETGRARRLSEVTVENPETAYGVLREYMRRLYDAGLVHGDLSEYNVVVHAGHLYVLDLGQAVTVHHPNSGEFLERDCHNVAAFFRRLGLEVSDDELRSYVVREDDDEVEGDDPIDDEAVDGDAPVDQAADAESVDDDVADDG